MNQIKTFDPASWFGKVKKVELDLCAVCGMKIVVAWNRHQPWCYDCGKQKYQETYGPGAGDDD